jgi:acetyl-CoA C-acetyltransferase
MAEAWLIDGLRSPRGKGKPGGGLHEIHPQEVLAQVLNALRDRVGFDPADVDDVVMGNGEQKGDHGNDIARMAVLAAGWPITTPGVSLNRFCGSGQNAIMFAAMGILAGWQDLVVAGGVESMSRFTVAPGGADFTSGNAALREKHPLVPQGISADLIATIEGHSREEVDAFGVQSQDRAAKAIAEGRFSRSVVSIRGADGSVALDHDEHPRPGATVESLGQLKAAFVKMGAYAMTEGGPTFDELCSQVYPDVKAVNHVHHAGNSSGVVDGAAAMLLASPDYARAHGLTPRANVTVGAVAGAEPVIMLTAPGPASEIALRKAGMHVGDIDLWEINEAFASVPLKTIRDLNIDPEKVNVNGGAIALGHPIGATGAILFQTAIDELERQDKSTALITMCTGGGMATATIIERI